MHPRSGRNASIPTTQNGFVRSVSSRLTALTLFAGGGLADLGIAEAGFQIVGAVEFDPAIASVYALNHGADHLHVADVAAVDYRRYSGVDWAHASPSCKNASQANPDAGEAAEDLIAAAAVCRMLREARPRWFTLENVTGYRHFRSFGNILAELRALGYTVWFGNVQMADYAVPQTRRRLILRAARNGRIPTLTPTHAERPEPAGLFAECARQPWVGWYAAVEDLIPTLPEGKLARWQVERLPAELRTCLVGGANTSETQAAPGVGDSDAGEPTRCVNGSNSLQWRAILVDGGTVNRPEPTLREAEAPALTVTVADGRAPLRAILSARVVRMTPRALARFQAVPDHYLLPDSDSLAARVIGNGVPPRFMRVLGRGWLELDAGREPEARCLIGGAA